MARSLGDDVPSVNHAGNPSQDPEEDVDAELSSEAAFEYNGQRWDEYGEKVETDIVTRRDIGGGWGSAIAAVDRGCSVRISHA